MRPSSSDHIRGEGHLDQRVAQVELEAEVVELESSFFTPSQILKPRFRKAS